ncbi:MAG: hypothetical protein ACXV7D_14820, partial [Thermoanaerobaculia bacterium]
ESVPFVVDPRPFARDLHDATYGGSRVNVAFVNFDREREVTFTIGGRDGKDSWGGTFHSDPVEVRVPAGSVRQVPLQLVSFTGSNVPPIFPYDTPLVSQVFGVGSSNVGGDWATYATLIDGTSAASTFFFDAMTDSR